MQSKETTWEVQMVADLSNEITNVKIERAQLKVQVNTQAEIIGNLQQEVEKLQAQIAEMESPSLELTGETAAEETKPKTRKVN